MKDGTHCSSLHRFEGGGSSLPHHPFHCSHPYSSSGLSVCSSTLDWHLVRPIGSFLLPARHVPTPNAGPPKNWIFFPSPPLLTQHYKVWQSIHSLFSVESDKGEVAGGAGFSAEWGRMESDLQQWLKRCMDNISRWWRRWRRSDLRQRALRHPPSFPPFPHPQSLRRPCLRGRRGSSTIANGSAAEWWRGVMKPITAPINLTPRGILSDWMYVKAALCMCVIGMQGSASFNSAFQGTWKRLLFFSFFFLAAD